MADDKKIEKPGEKAPERGEGGRFAPAKKAAPRKMPVRVGGHVLTRRGWKIETR